MRNSPNIVPPRSCRRACENRVTKPPSRTRYGRPSAPSSAVCAAPSPSRSARAAATACSKPRRNARHARPRSATSQNGVASCSANVLRASSTPITTCASSMACSTLTTLHISRVNVRVGRCAPVQCIHWPCRDAIPSSRSIGPKTACPVHRAASSKYRRCAGSGRVSRPPRVIVPR